MFGQGSKTKRTGKRDAPPRQSATARNGGVNTIDEHTTITGDLEAGGDIRIDGKLIGDLQCQGRLIVGTTGIIEGDVRCVEAVIEGRYTGHITVSQLLTLKETSTVSGSIRAHQLAIGAGCKLDGQVAVAEMTAAAPPVEKPAAKPAALATS